MPLKVDKNPSIKISTIVNKKYMATHLLGKGGYGVVYEVFKLNAPSVKLACKAEVASQHKNIRSEWDLMSQLQASKAKHSIAGVETGFERNYNYMIMHIVGPSLSELRKATPQRKFTLFTTSICAIQCFESIFEIHKLGYIHRDVKPSNFAIGILGSEKEKLIHILDFGLCRCIFKGVGSKQLRKPRAKVPFRGTVQYASLNIHLRLEPGRHDDFWSLLFMLIEAHTGNLPWGETANKEEAKRGKENKLDELLEKCPLEFRLFKSHLLSLTYTREPNYEKIRVLFWQLISKNKFSLDMPLDWQKGGEHGGIFAPRSRIYSMRRLDAAGGGGGKELKLADIIECPKEDVPVMLEESDFPQTEYDPPRDVSTSRSDDTIQITRSSIKHVKKTKVSPQLPAATTPKKTGGFMGKMGQFITNVKKKKSTTKL